MSSPYCCGCIALILSGLKHDQIDYNPFGVKRALENSSLKLDDDVLGTGAGLVQVESTFDYLKNFKEEIYQKIHFEVEFQLDSKLLRGVYLLNESDVLSTNEFRVTINPIFYENKLIEKTVKIQNDKINFRKELTLVCEHKWAECASQLVMVNESQEFSIRIKADELEEGNCHFTQLIAYDVADLTRLNPIFKIPITVVKPFR